MRSLVAVSLAFGAALALGAACGSGSTDACRDGSVSDDGSCSPDVGVYYQPCSGKVVSLIPAGDCPSQGCSQLAYAVCNGKDWVPCSCAIPPGYTLVDAGFFGPEGGETGRE